MEPPVRSTRPYLRLLAPVLAAGLVLTACGGSEEEPAETSSSAAAPAEEPLTWPLTGLEAADGATVAKKHPPYIAKIDNTSNSAPQVGLGKADLVVEELVEGGYTRLAVFFYQNLPTRVGPVRSMRATDVGIASPVDATIIASGAAQFTKNALDQAGVKFIEEGAAGITRDPSRSSLYSVMADLKAIGSTAKTKAARPADYFPWGDPADFPGTRKVGGITADFGNHASEWAFRNGEYVLTNGYMAQGDAFNPQTLVVAQVRTSLAPYKDPGGNDVPISHFEGKGQAWVFHNGTMVRGTWEKDAPSAEVTFTTKDGKDLTIPAGKVWLELVPQQGGSVRTTP